VKSQSQNKPDGSWLLKTYFEMHHHKASSAHFYECQKCDSRLKIK